jgi:long-chain acyl-CoA synthetase
MGSMVWPLRRAVTVAAGSIAMRCGPVELTYGQTWDRCLVGALRDLGAGPGDRVAIIGPNCHRYLEIYQAVPAAGMVVVPLNQRHTVAELQYALEDSATKVLFTSRDAGALSTGVERVFDLGPGYEALLAAAAPGEFDDERPPWSTAGTGRGTSATWTATPICTSSTGPRT